MNLDFLKNVGINEEELDKKAPRASGGGHRKEWNPTHPLTIRVWKDGSVFPSADLAERFDLEYVDRPAAGEPEELKKWSQPGNAFDIIDSQDFPVFRTPKRLILANVIAKSEGKADLFRTGDWDAVSGAQNASVMTQGANTFGKSTFVPMIKEVYGTDLLAGEQPYVDLTFIGKDGEKASQHFALPEGKKVCFIPKKIARGDKQGAPTVVRREDPWLYILVPLPYEAKKPEEKGAKLSVAEGAEK